MTTMIGSDPELILMFNGKPKSSVGIIGGSKDNPRKTVNGYVLEDNVLVEFNPNPASTVDEFIRNHKLVLQDLEDIIKPLGYYMEAEATAKYPKKELLSAQAREFGCEPDFDAWNVVMNDVPEPGNLNLRSAGGHLHVSFDQANSYENARIDFIRTMDCMLGIPSVLIDSNNQRRKLYGKAGAHRPKYTDFGHPYDGAEYRVLSNFWLKSEELMTWVFNQTIEAVERIDEFVQRIDKGEIKAQQIIQAINKSNQDFAYEFCNKFDIKVAA